MRHRPSEEVKGIVDSGLFMGFVDRKKTVRQAYSFKATICLSLWTVQNV